MPGDSDPEYASPVAGADFMPYVDYVLCLHSQEHTLIVFVQNVVPGEQSMGTGDMARVEEAS